jgi:hypothetical protein
MSKLLPLQFEPQALTSARKPVPVPYEPFADAPGGRYRVQAFTSTPFRSAHRVSAMQLLSAHTLVRRDRNNPFENRHYLCKNKAIQRKGPGKQPERIERILVLTKDGLHELHLTNPLRA